VLVNVAAIQRDDSEVVLEGIVVDIADRERAAAAEREAEALRAVTKLANAAAHEINNPLAVIVAHLDLLEKRHRDDPDVIHRIGHARTACRRITEMIEHMGRITRLEMYEQPAYLPPILDLRRSSDPRGRTRRVTPS
jgi:signal transduction histidine kinase